MTKKTTPNEASNETSRNKGGAKEDFQADVLSLSGLERQVLKVLRQFLMGYTNATGHMWETAFETCLRDFGPTHGPNIGVAVMKSIQALRTTRKTTFRFKNPGCPCCRGFLSGHEKYFMYLLRAWRSDDGLARQTQTILLCEGEDAEGFSSRMKALSDQLDQYSAVSNQSGFLRPGNRLKITYRDQ